MNKLISTGIACVLSSAGLTAIAQDTTKKQDSMKGGTAMKEGMPMKEGKMDMKMMDANGDGMISKKEFVKHHESMYDKMKKGSNGMVSVKDMEMMRDGMMKK